jgi:GTP cyclohydrolase IA
VHGVVTEALDDAFSCLTLDAIGRGHPAPDDLADTPARAARAWAELTSGYGPPPELREFPANGHDEIVAVSGIPFYSLCEHHLLPFHGHAHIAYLPSDRLVGLSKLARVVNHYARRLQLQERLTDEIADHLTDALKPRGVAVIVQAEHLCMAMRGAQTPGTRTTTSVMRGRFRESTAGRAEVLRLLGVA